MAIAAFHGLACKGQQAALCPSIYCVHKVRECNSLAVAKSLVQPTNVKKKIESLPRGKTNGVGNDGDYKALEWKRLSSGELGIQTSVIASSTRLVLSGLWKKGTHKVLRTFPRSEVIGKRFPICHLHVEDTVVEVSSFSIVVRKFGRHSHYAIRKRCNCDEVDLICWMNCLNRDFTINGLMFDPFARIVYDYTGGLEDIRRAKYHSCWHFFHG